MKKILPFLLLVMMFSSCLEEPEYFENTYTGNFESLWQTVDQRYCYLDYKHINWDSIHTVYQSRLSSIYDEVGFFDLMGQMLSELKDGHVNLYSDFDKSRYWKWFQDYDKNFSKELIEKEQYLGKNYRIAGGFRYKPIANGKIGYMYLGDFSSPVEDKNLLYIFREFQNCDAVIVDVRDNGGGSLASAQYLASCFMEKETLVGYMSHKTGNAHSDFSKPAEIRIAPSVCKWKKKVAVLCNRMSYSATNAFVSYMRYAPNATIIGDKTGGGGGLPLTNEMPNGWLVRFSACPMYDAAMEHTEWGINPDYKVSLNSTDEATGVDTIIDWAIGFLLK